MDTLIELPAVLTRTTRADLHLRRTGISFFNVAPDRVRIEIEVTNRGEEPSRPTMLVVEAAVLGAFVPWQPLKKLQVPAIDPGRSLRVATDVLQSPTRVLGDFSAVPPRALVAAAAGAADSAPSPGPSGQRRRRLPGLPADLLALLRQGSIHWAGNLNVFIGRKSVERHLARALRIYPGRNNLAAFMVGSGPDAYSFQLEGEGADWEAGLFDVTGRDSFVPNPDGGNRITPHSWQETAVGMAVMLMLRPPQACRAGAVEVHVRQRSTGRSAVVEFSLDPSAAGAGCFVV